METDKSNLLYERSAISLRNKGGVLGGKHSEMKLPRTNERSQPTLKVEVYEPKVIESRDYEEIVKDEREELKDSFKEDLKRDREKRLLQRYSEEKVQVGRC